MSRILHKWTLPEVCTQEMQLMVGMPLGMVCPSQDPLSGGTGVSLVMMLTDPTAKLVSTAGQSFSHCKNMNYENFKR